MNWSHFYPKDDCANANMLAGLVAAHGLLGG